MTVVVAIDGPAGSGKSSVARAAANALGYGFLDTGSAYRVLTWVLLKNEIDLNATEQVLELLAEQQMYVPLRPDEPLLMGCFAFGDEIRTPEVTAQISVLSRQQPVRDALNEIFRQQVASCGLPGVVVEGRDMTTVVFPEAQLRILLTASARVRAARRHLQQPQLSLEQVFADLQERDAKDLKVVNFLEPAPGVQLLDTTELNFDGAVWAVIQLLRGIDEQAVLRACAHLDSVGASEV